jgi:hypothetical protein
MFDMFYGAAAAAAGYDGGIYTREVFDAVAIIGLAEATALRTPVATDGAKEMLGTVVAAQGAPQDGASGSHAFDDNGDVAGSGFDVCTFGADADGNTTLDCHSSWGLFEGLIDDGIPKKPPAVPGCMDSTANNFNADATEADGSCTFDTTEPEDVPGCMDSAADNFNADATSDDGSCEYTVDVDEVPGFGLLAAVAAIGVALILRRRL